MNQRLNDLEKKLLGLLLAARNRLSMALLEKKLSLKRNELKEIVLNINRKMEELNLPVRILEVENYFEPVLDKDTGSFVDLVFKKSPDYQTLSRAALETLAVIAVYQPISRKDIMRIRGVTPDSSLATLFEFGLVDKIEKDGKSYYVTTENFLKALGLKSLKEFKKLLKNFNEDERKS